MTDETKQEIEAVLMLLKNTLVGRSVKENVRQYIYLCWVDNRR